MSQGIENKVVVITGASSGLGEATARHLAERGAIVMLGAPRRERIDALAAELTSKGCRAVAVETDVTDRKQVQNLVDTAVRQFGHVDVMLNNAGLMPLAPLERLKVDEWDRMIDVNIKGVLYGIAAALPYMKERKIAVGADTFARTVAFAVNEPDDVDINEILFRPTAQPV